MFLSELQNQVWLQYGRHEGRGWQTSEGNVEVLQAKHRGAQTQASFGYHHPNGMPPDAMRWV